MIQRYLLNALLSSLSIILVACASSPTEITQTPTKIPTPVPTSTHTPIPTLTISIPDSLEPITTDNARLIKRIRALRQKSVSDIAFSPDGTLLASGSTDDSILRLWDTKTGKLISSLQGHTDGITTVAFSPNGKLLGSASADGTARLWDVQSMKELALFTDQRLERMEGLAFSPSGDLLATVNWGSLILWDLRTFEKRFSFNIFGLETTLKRISKVTFSSDGTNLVTFHQGDIIIWDVETGKAIGVIVGFYQISGSGMAVNPVDDRMIIGSGRDDIRDVIKIWNKDVVVSHREDERFSEDHQLIGHGHDITDLAFSPDGNLIASVSTDQSVRIWDTKTYESVAMLGGQGNWLSSVAFSSDGKLIASGSGDGNIWLLGVPYYPPQSRAGISLSLTENGELVFALSTSGNYEGYFQEVEQYVQSSWPITNKDTARYEISVSPIMGTVWNSCAYISAGARVIQAEMDIMIEVFDFTEHKVIDKTVFQGGHPEECPRSISISGGGVGGTYYLFGEPPPVSQLEEWLNMVIAKLRIQ